METTRATLGGGNTIFQLLWVGSALSAGYLQKIRPSLISKALIGTSVFTCASYPYSRSLSRTFQFLLGAMLFGQAIIKAQYSLRIAKTALKAKHLRGAEEALFKATFHLGIQGTFGLSLAYLQLEKEIKNVRKLRDPLFYLFDPNMRKLWRHTANIMTVIARFRGQEDKLDEWYDERILKLLRVHWNELSEGEKEVVFNGIWDGSWRISLNRFLDELKEGTQLKGWLSKRKPVDTSEIEKTLEQVDLQFSEFEKILKEVDQETSLLPEKQVELAQRLHPIWKYQQFMEEPILKEMDKQEIIENFIEKKEKNSLLKNRKVWLGSIKPLFVTIAKGRDDWWKEREPKYVPLPKKQIPSEPLIDRIVDEVLNAANTLLSFALLSAIVIERGRAHPYAATLAGGLGLYVGTKQEGKNAKITLGTDWLLNSTHMILYFLFARSTHLFSWAGASAAIGVYTLKSSATLTDMFKDTTPKRSEVKGS